MKIDTGIGSDLGSVASRVRAAEEAGLDCAWAAETVNDPFLSLALAAEHSDRCLSARRSRSRSRATR